MKSPGTSNRMPVLFIGHGSPMNAILKNDYTESLRTLGKNLPRPEAVLVISAHWLTRGTFVTCMEQPRQIYDFYGFPDELYDVRYPARGAPDAARRTTGLAEKVRISCSNEWGLDHASWAVLRHLFPEADVPVFEMSLDVTAEEAAHYDLGRRLSALRNEGILIVGSGNIVHNLRTIAAETDAPPVDWSVEVDEKVKVLLIRGEHAPLIRWKELGPNAGLAVPTTEHYLPMLYSIALQAPGESLRFTFEGIQNGSISMRCFRIG
jgi:4,5-DOPA dioxygenase extradiol